MEPDILGKYISSLSSRKFDQALYHVIRTRNNTDPLFSAPCLKDDYSVDLLISQERERLSLSHYSRRT